MNKRDRFANHRHRRTDARTAIPERRPPRRPFYEDRLPVHLGVAKGLPASMDAVIATADLQGRENFLDSGGGPLRLLGEVLPGKLVEICVENGIRPERVGVLLAGDFYAVPDLRKRGGSGDLREVWRAFGNCFRWVVGVAGNHDTFGDDASAVPRFPASLHYLRGHSHWDEPLVELSEAVQVLNVDARAVILRRAA